MSFIKYFQGICKRTVSPVWQKLIRRNRLSSKEEKINTKSSSKWETIEIKDRVYSRNKIDRMHWSAKRKLKKQYQLLIRNQIRLSGYKPAETKYKLSINCYVPRLMDIDNLWGGLKQFIDALTTEKFIYDDSNKWLEIKQIKQFKNKEPKILVERKAVS